MKRCLVSLINFYQAYLSFDKGVLVFFAPGGACRFDTRCSQYTKKMIIKEGVIKGVIAGIKRIGSCR